MGSVPLLATQIRPPESPINQYGSVVQLANLLQEQKIRQQMAPVQLATAQAQSKTAQIGSQEAEMEYGYKKKLYDAFSDPSFKDEAFGTGQAENAQSGSQPSGGGYGFNPDNFVQALVKRGVPAPLAIQAGQPFLEYAKSQAGLTKDQQDIHSKTLDNITARIAPMLDEVGPNGDSQKLQVMQQEFGNYLNDPATLAGLTPQEQQEAQLVAKIDGQHLPAVAGMLGIMGKIASYHKAQSDAIISGVEAKQKASGLAEASEWQTREAKGENPTLDFISSVIPEIGEMGTSNASPITALGVQAHNLFNQVLRSSNSVEEANKAIAPMLAEANRMRALPYDKQQEMKAQYNQNLQLASQIPQSAYIQTININGKDYTFADPGVMKNYGALAPYASILATGAKASLAPTEQVAARLRGLQADEKNLMDLQKALSGEQPTNALVRAYMAPTNWVKRKLQIDPNRAGAYQAAGEDIIRNIISAGSEGGMRGVPEEVVRQARENLPQFGDTPEVAQNKVQNIRNIIQRIVEANLPGTNTASPAAATKSPSAAQPKVDLSNL